MVTVRVSLRLRFVKLLDSDDDRIFRDDLLITDPDAVGFEDLRNIIERKLAFMEMPQSDFTVFFLESATGDRVVVDDVYLARLVQQWWEEAHTAAQRKTTPRGGRPGASPPGLLLLGSEENECLSRALRCGADHIARLAVGEGEEEEEMDVVHAVSATFDVEPRVPPHHHRGEVARLLRTSVLADTTRDAASDHGQAAAVTPHRCLPLTVANLNQWEQRGGAVAGVDTPRPPAAPPCAVPVAQTSSASSATPSAWCVFVPVHRLTCPPQPQRAPWALRCVVLVMRCKSPTFHTSSHSSAGVFARTAGSGVTVMELDLCDAAALDQHITAVTFDAAVQRELMSRLRDGGRHVIEIRGAHVRRKNEMDRRFETNTHPLLLRLDCRSRIDLVQILPAPMAVAASTAEGSTRRGVMDLHHLLSATRGTTGPSRATPAHGASDDHSVCTGGANSPHSHSHSRGALGGANGPVGSCGGSSGSSHASFLSHPSLGPPAAHTAAGLAVPPCAPLPRRATGRRTTFCTPTRCSADIPALLGQALREQQTRCLAQANKAAADTEDELPREPGVCHVSQRTVRQREPLLQAYAERALDRKSRIRRRVEVVHGDCLLCGLDTSGRDEVALMDEVARLLRANYRNKGTQIPSADELRRALSDRRGVPAGATPTRMHCEAHFVRLSTKSVHRLHPRCAHLCTRYQRGAELEDLVMYELPMQMCALCGLAGATVQCYHPRCEEQYHVVCALYSQGYVDFGKKDPYLPCPACPRHTLVPLRPRAESDVLHVDHSCWEDGVAFDSRVVESTDLRDPDENDGD